MTCFLARFFGGSPNDYHQRFPPRFLVSEQRGVTVIGYAIAVYGGPTIGPIVGDALSSSYL